jgi:hypothetical protein
MEHRMETDQESVAPPRGDYFAEDEYLRTDMAAGVARNRAGARLLALPEPLLHALDQTLTAECGSAAERVLKSAGRVWGQRCAERLENELGEYFGEPLAAGPVARFQAALGSAFGRLGWGVLRLDFSRYDQGVIVAEVHNAPPAAPADALLAGALAGLFGHFAGLELDCVATPPEGRVHRFVLSLPERLERIGDALFQKRSHDEVLAELAEVRV